MKKDRIIVLIVLLILFGLGVLFANLYSLYYILPGFDKVMHALGGAVLGVFSTWILDRWEPDHVRFWHIVGAGATIGLLGGFIFEVIEFNLKNFGGVLDTVTDLIADLLGGAFSAWAVLRLFHPHDIVLKTTPVADQNLPEVYRVEIPQTDLSDSSKGQI